MRLAQGHNTVSPEWGSNPQPLDPESAALTTRPPRSPHIIEGANVGVCGLTWWRRPKKTAETTDLGQATTNLPHAYYRVCILATAVANEFFFTTTLARHLKAYKLTYHGPVFCMYNMDRSFTSPMATMEDNMAGNDVYHV